MKTVLPYKKKLAQAVAFCFIVAIIAVFSVQLYFLDDWVNRCRENLHGVQF
jgi:hypothetical protein